MSGSAAPGAVVSLPHHSPREDQVVEFSGEPATIMAATQGLNEPLNESDTPSLPARSSFAALAPSPMSVAWRRVGIGAGMVAALSSPAEKAIAAFASPSLAAFSNKDDSSGDGGGRSNRLSSTDQNVQERVERLGT